MTELFSLDIETAPLVEDGLGYALEPYRAIGNQATITSVSIWSSTEKLIALLYGDTLSQLPQHLRKLRGKPVFAQYAPFDVAWMIASGMRQECYKIKWLDTSTLGKWVENSQSNLSFSLATLIERWITDHPLLEEFLDTKAASVTPGEDFEYWLRRNEMDAEFTCLLGQKLLRELTQRQKRSYLIECQSIFPAADAWVRGLMFDINGVQTLNAKIEKTCSKISQAIGVNGTVINSSQQLGRFLYEDKGLPIVVKTSKGAPSCGKEALAKLHLEVQGTEYENLVRMLSSYKKLRTTQSKFLKGFGRVLLYNDTPTIHAAPRVFGTYTGRWTYSSKTLKKYQCGIATHQLPRRGPVRKLFRAPEGYRWGELDANSQESRIIAIQSFDEGLIEAFEHDKSTHTMLGAELASISYEELERRIHEDDAESKEVRQRAKLTNLSAQYRIGAKSLALKFLVDYGVVMPVAGTANLLRVYKRRWRGIPRYWDDAIDKAKANGFAESLGGRRYYLEKWGGASKWMTESSAINHPIQASGGDHKNVALAVLTKKYPELLFVLDLHDGLHFYVPEENGEELLLEARATLNAIDYEQIWDRELPVSLPFDAKIGPSMGELKEIS